MRIGNAKRPKQTAFIAFDMLVQEIGGRLDRTAASATVAVESADFVAEAMAPAHSPRPAYANAAVAICGERCYCEQSLVDRGQAAQLAPCASADPYAGTLARWFGVSTGELDELLRDL